MTDDNDDDDDEWRTFFLCGPHDAVSTPRGKWGLATIAKPPRPENGDLPPLRPTAASHRRDALIDGEVLLPRIVGEVHAMARRTSERELFEDLVAALALISEAQRALPLSPLFFRNLTPQQPTAFDHARRPLPIETANVMHIG